MSGKFWFNRVGVLNFEKQTADVLADIGFARETRTASLQE
jgi:hypothetical protein